MLLPLRWDEKSESCCLPLSLYDNNYTHFYVLYGCGGNYSESWCMKQKKGTWGCRIKCVFFQWQPWERVIHPGASFFVILMTLFHFIKRTAVILSSFTIITPHNSHFYEEAAFDYYGSSQVGVKNCFILQPHPLKHYSFSMQTTTDDWNFLFAFVCWPKLQCFTFCSL